MDNIATLPTPSRQRRKKTPADIEITLDGVKHPVLLQMEDKADWAVIFEDVLEVRTKGVSRYWPLSSVKEWKVVEHGVDSSRTESN